MTEIQTAPRTRPPSTDDLDHVVCCADYDVSLCGLDVSDLPLVNDDEDTSCVVCADLEWTEFCPLGKRCP